MLEILVVLSTAMSGASLAIGWVNFRAIKDMQSQYIDRVDSYAAALLEQNGEPLAARHIKPKPAEKKETLPMQRPRQIGMSPRTYG